MDAKYTTTDIAKLGIKRERLKRWMKLGYIKPSTPADGPGTKALFTKADLYKIQLFRILLEYGFPAPLAEGQSDILIRSFEGRRIEVKDDTLPANIREATKKAKEGSNRWAQNDFIAFPKRSSEPVEGASIMAIYNDIDGKITIDPDEFSDYEAVIVVNWKKIRDAVDHLER